MEQGDTSLTVKISGKNQRGEQFQEVAKLEAFGNFGVLIHTLQPLGLGDVIHISGNNNKPIACAEVIWIRGGDTPSLEILLHRNTDIAEVVAVNESVVPQKTSALPSLSGAGGVTRPLQMSKANDSLPSGKTSSLTSNSLSGATNKSIDTSKSIPSSSSSNVESDNNGEAADLVCSSCNKANPVTSKSCKFCGSYLSRGTSTLRSNTLGKMVEEVKAAHASGTTDNITDSSSQNKSPLANSLSGKTSSSSSNKSENNRSLSGETSSSSINKRPSRPSSETTSGTVRTSAKDKEKLNTLVQQQKIALIAVVVFSMLLVATFIPLGSSLEPTSLDVVEQTGCLHVSALKRQTADIGRTGELEYWTQDKEKNVQFVKKQLTAGDAGTEVDNIIKSGTEIHGYWCPKAESKLVTKAQLPKNLAGLWTFNPTGPRAKDAGAFSLQLRDRTLVMKEKIAQAEVDRTNDIKQATYYTGQQKLAVILNDLGSTKVNAAILRELTFYLPSSQDPMASAEGVLSNTVRPFYIGEYKDPTAQTDIRQILMYIFGGLAALSLGYLVFNFYQIKSV